MGAGFHCWGASITTSWCAATSDRPACATASSRSAADGDRIDRIRIADRDRRPRRADRPVVVARPPTPILSLRAEHISSSRPPMLELRRRCAGGPSPCLRRSRGARRSSCSAAPARSSGRCRASRGVSAPASFCASASSRVITLRRRRRRGVPVDPLAALVDAADAVEERLRRRLLQHQIAGAELDCFERPPRR